MINRVATICLVAMVALLSACGAFGPRERWAYEGPNYVFRGGEKEQPNPKLGKLNIGVPNGKYSYNGYFSVWRNADQYEITYVKEGQPSAGSIVQLIQITPSSQKVDLN